VDGLERRWGHAIRVERFNVGEDVGQEVYELLGASGVPTTVLFDADGDEIYREERKLPRPDQVEAALTDSGVRPQ
jgi:hypothetical protein